MNTLNSLPDDSLPNDWKKYHTEQLGRIRPDKREAAIQFLMGYFSDAPDTVKQIQEAAEKDPQTWWSSYHLTWGMGVRNLLRRHGFGEKYLGVENLDDCYVGLISAALIDNQSD